MNVDEVGFVLPVADVFKGAYAVEIQLLVG